MLSSLLSGSILCLRCLRSKSRAFETKNRSQPLLTNLPVQLINFGVRLFALVLIFAENVTGTFEKGLFPGVIMFGCTPKRWASSAVVSSFLMAARATLALNSGLCCRRFLLR